MSMRPLGKIGNSIKTAVGSGVSQLKGKMSRGNSVTIGSRIPGTRKVSVNAEKLINMQKKSAARNPRYDKFKAKIIKGIKHEKVKNKTLKKYESKLENLNKKIDQLPKNKRGKIDSQADKQTVYDIFDKVNEEAIKLEALSESPKNKEKEQEIKSLLNDYESVKENLRNWIVWNR